MNLATSFRLFATLVAAWQSASAADQSSALSALSTQLATEKAKPEGAQSAAKCPNTLAEFKGLSRLDIHKSLGGPDTFKLKTISPPKISEATYFIGPKAPQGARGGGRPEITFHFNDSEQVLWAVCTSSK